MFPHNYFKCSLILVLNVPSCLLQIFPPTYFKCSIILISIIPSYLFQMFPHTYFIIFINILEWKIFNKIAKSINFEQLFFLIFQILNWISASEMLDINTRPEQWYLHIAVRANELYIFMCISLEENVCGLQAAN